MQQVVGPGVGEQHVHVLSPGQIHRRVRPTITLDVDLTSRGSMDASAQLEQPETERAADETRSARYEKLFFGNSANLK